MIFATQRRYCVRVTAPVARNSAQFCGLDSHEFAPALERSQSRQPTSTPSHLARALHRCDRRGPRHRRGSPRVPSEWIPLPTSMTEGSFVRRLRRPQVRGKYLFVGNQKLLVRGTTYGTFRPDAHGNEYGTRDQVERDLVAIAANGFNALRTYTVPPRWLLDLAERARAARHGRPSLGAARRLPRRAARGATPSSSGSATAVSSCAGHPAVLVRDRQRDPGADRPLARAPPGGAVPRAAVPRGRRRGSRGPGHLRELPDHRVPRAPVPRPRVLQRVPRVPGAPDAPTSRASRTWPATGRSSWRRSGSTAAGTAWPRRPARSTGRCGPTFAPVRRRVRVRLDRRVASGRLRHRGLGLRSDSPRPAAEAGPGRRAAGDAPRRPSRGRPAGRGSRSSCAPTTARAPSATACEGLRRLDYPDFEVIVVNDGSTDATADIVEEYGFRLISSREPRPEPRAERRARAPRRARSSPTSTTTPIPTRTGCATSPPPSSGPRTSASAGPNIPPPGDGPVAECVANAPGGPIHVLLSDQEAEHIPGCNMAFRRRRCRRSAASTPSSAPPATTWTSAGGCASGGGRSASTRAPWCGITAATRCACTGSSRRGTARAEALLERKWPEKYNGAGHVSWAGRLYGLGLHPDDPAPARPHLPGLLGQRPVPVALPAGAGRPRRAAPDAGVVSGDPDPRAALGAGARVAPAAGGIAAPGVRGGRARRPGRCSARRGRGFTARNGLDARRSSSTP